MTNLKRKDLYPWFINTAKLKIVDGKKYCSICDAWLPLENYEKDSCKYLGYRYWCRECISKHE